MKKTINNTLVIFVLAMIICSCQKQAIPQSSESIEQDESMELVTKSITPEVFDWETADYMPTPPGQAQIHMPWADQGSLSGFYGLDIVNDYLKVDGWRMVYSSFRDYGEELIDPYFVLYNIYRGTLRIYFFLTNPYLGTSTYLQDALVLNSSSVVTSNILNYLNNERIDPEVNVYSYNQIQPRMLNGGAPLASRRWYMMEYEMAYDPNISNLSSDQIRLSWYLDYYNIGTISINGTAKSQLFGTVGGKNNFLSETMNNTAKGVLSIIGLDTLEGLSTNDDGGNKIGISEYLFERILDGIGSAVNSIAAGVPGAVVNFMNSVFGGSSGSQTAVSVKSDTSIGLSGTSSSIGAVSSTPIDMKIPGTQISDSATGYVPLYNQPLGVFYWKGGVKVHVNEQYTVTREADDIMNTGTYEVKHHTANADYQNYFNYVTVNPAVSAVANVTKVSQTLYAEDTDGNLHQFPLTGTVYDNPYEWDLPIPDVERLCVKMLLKVSPKDGAPDTYITKTFYIDDFTWTKTRVY